MRALLLAVRETAHLFGRQRMLWLPFVCVTFVEALFVGLAWLAPHAPFSDVLAPPIRFLFGDRVLHYPAHLWFLYHVTRHAYIAAAVLVGAFMTGVACAMVGQIHTGATLSFRDVLVNRQVLPWCCKRCLSTRFLRRCFSAQSGGKPCSPAREKRSTILSAPSLS